jgi:nitrogen fixation protein NifB
VASLEGVLVNQHLGEAESLWIFRREGDRFVHAESRPAPPAGLGAARWRMLGETLHDCHTLLVSGSGETPKKALAAGGIRVVVTEGVIESLVEDLFAQKKLPAPRSAHACGVGCSGTGKGCG